jgi:hypothetical protein
VLPCLHLDSDSGARQTKYHFEATDYMIHVRDSVLYASALTQFNRKQVFLPESCIVSSSCVIIDITTAATAAAAAAVRHKYKDSHSHVPI